MGTEPASDVFLPPLLMIVFRQKHPRWWFDWNRELFPFSTRIGAYLALMDDRYPSTDEQQAVALDFPYPEADPALHPARLPVDSRHRRRSCS
jgi:hypothetical protein